MTRLTSYHITVKIKDTDLKHPHLQNNFIIGCPKAALLFWSFLVILCVVCCFVCVIDFKANPNTKIRKQEKMDRLTLLHSEKPKLYTILAFLSAIGFMFFVYFDIVKVMPSLACFVSVIIW